MAWGAVATSTDPFISPSGCIKIHGPTGSNQLNDFSEPVASVRSGCAQEFPQPTFCAKPPRVVHAALTSTDSLQIFSAGAPSSDMLYSLAAQSRP